MRDIFIAIRRSTETFVLYANELLQCDCHSSGYRQVILARHVGYASVMQLPLQLVRDVITTPRQASDINVVRRSQLIRGEGSRRSRPTLKHDLEVHTKLLLLR